MSLAIGGRLSKQSDPLARENSNEVWMSRRVTYPKKAAGLGTLRLLLVLSEAPRSLSLTEPRDQLHANRWYVRKKHASERLV